MYKKILKYIIIVVLMFVSFEFGAYFAARNDVIMDLSKKQAVYAGKILGKFSEPEPGQLTQDIDFSLFWDVWESVSSLYVDQEKVNEKKMFYGAIRGMVDSLEDPYTVFMDPKISKDFTDDLAGTFEGIGAEIGIKDDILTIVAPLPEMPAEKAGLMAGDKVFLINGESTMGISIDEAVNKIRGPKGTEVVLSIAREGKDGLTDFTIERGKIIVKSVRETHRDDDIYVVKITNFNNDTIDLFNKAVRNIIKKNPKGIIVDLRNNPGGYLDTAIEMASEWVETGVVVTEHYSEDNKNEHLARGRARLKSYKTVVLVNEGSASAAEIVSGALQDYDEAIIVGKKTFGKGSVQTLSNFSDGSSVKITVAKWLTPKGRSINDEGIEPDNIIDLTLDDYNSGNDPQMEVAIGFLNGEDIGVGTTTEKVSSSTDLN